MSVEELNKPRPEPPGEKLTVCFDHDKQGVMSRNSELLLSPRPFIVLSGGHLDHFRVIARMNDIPLEGFKTTQIMYAEDEPTTEAMILPVDELAKLIQERIKDEKRLTSFINGLMLFLQNELSQSTSYMPESFLDAAKQKASAQLDTDSISRMNLDLFRTDAFVKTKLFLLSEGVQELMRKLGLIRVTEGQIEEVGEHQVSTYYDQIVTGLRTVNSSSLGALAEHSLDHLYRRKKRENQQFGSEDPS